MKKLKSLNESNFETISTQNQSMITGGDVCSRREGTTSTDNNCDEARFSYYDDENGAWHTEYATLEYCA
jgi:hypothetical protein